MTTGSKKKAGGGKPKPGPNFLLPQLLVSNIDITPSSYNVGKKGRQPSSLSAMDFQLGSPGAVSAVTDDYSTASEFTMGSSPLKQTSGARGYRVGDGVKVIFLFL